MSTEHDSDIPAGMMDAGIRLAFRTEGDFVNCYFTRRETMEGALLLGSMKVTICQKGFFEPWTELMQQILAKAVLDSTGIEKVTMMREAAPEHERAGRA